MTKIEKNNAPFGVEAPDNLIKLAVIAVGGQGGGVLTGWIETMARAQGYSCQTTSVAGVAQRTGATIYYVEMAPKNIASPVFSLAPAAGDVDIVIAAEMMEAGRAIMRGFVTPDRTTLIASTHRALAVTEKMAPGDGIADSGGVRAAAEIAAQHLVMIDLERVAVETGSVVSAGLFGALAATERLPFARSAFEDAIRTGGKGVETSLRAFAAAFDIASGTTAEGVTPAGNAPLPRVSGPAELLKGWHALEQRLAHFPQAVRPMAQVGLRKVVDFQDLAYGAAYLDRLDETLAKDRADKAYMLGQEAAKYVANAMAYDDIIKVADLKSRPTRFSRISDEMGLRADRQMKLTEYFHPRAEEISGLMPVRMGRWFEARPARMARLNRWFGKGRRIRSNGLSGFGMLYMLGGRQSWRLKTLRHAHEVNHLEKWLAHVLKHVNGNYDLAVELLRCRRLIKGYSDTHARGLTKFDRVCAVADQLADRPDAADWIRRLITAALADEQGHKLEQALKTIATF